MRWAVGIVACSRNPSYLQETIESVHRAGWNGPRVFFDLKQNGAWKPWIDGLFSLNDRAGPVDAYLMVQDDVRIASGARQYIEKTIGAVMRTHDAMATLYASSVHHKPQHEGWFVEREIPVHGALTTIMPSHAVHYFRKFCQGNPDLQGSGIDTKINMMSKDYQMTRFVHSPSLAWHLGDVSALGPDKTATGTRQCAMFRQDCGSLEAKRWTGKL